ncbi:MAG: class C sortase [Lachnospiraceae bacterium]|nr:class C sortase [Lachnospiraceae bacterium]
MKRIIINILIGMTFLAGLSVLLYPTVSDYINELHSSRAIASYEDSVIQLEEEDYTKEVQLAIEYNEYLAGFSELSAAAGIENEREDSPYRTLLNISGNGIIGSIRIPSVKINLPIYHGTEESVLQTAVGHYLGSSLPIGGESTHAILTGHRGLPSAKLFTDLDRLEVGDIFYIKVLGEILEYQIDQIEIVLPEEVEGLSIVPGEDYVTLVTCTPYGINSHRMLIRGTRIPYDGKYEEEVKMKPAPINSDVPKEEDQQGNGFTTKQWIWFGIAAFGAAIGAGLLLPGKKGTKTGTKTGTEADSGQAAGDRGKADKKAASRKTKKRATSSRTEKKEGSHEENE